MKQGMKAAACGMHILLTCTALPSNYLGIGVNAGLAVFWFFMFFSAPSSSPQVTETPHD